MSSVAADVSFLVRLKSSFLSLGFLLGKRSHFLPVAWTKRLDPKHRWRFHKVHFIHKDRTTPSNSEPSRSRLTNVLGGAEEEHRGWETG